MVQPISRALSLSSHVHVRQKLNCSAFHDVYNDESHQRKVFLALGRSCYMCCDRSAHAVAADDQLQVFGARHKARNM